MKHKITRRLISYFSAVLLLFSIISGGLFWILFTRHTVQIQEQELKNRAASIADTLSQISGTQRQGLGRGMGGGYGAYLRFLDDIAMSEVWLVDERAETIQMGHQGSALSYEQLPLGAEELIRQVFEGETAANREFSSLLDSPSVTVGAPVKDEGGNVTAAVLLHSPIDGMDRAVGDGFVILLFCIFSALVLAAVLSVFLARHFIGPLKKMADAAGKIAEGNYSVQTGVSQDDEIGWLAGNIDELLRKLSKAEAERSELDKLRQDFVSNISHELRTPVTVIKGSLEVLTEGLITEHGEMMEYFRQMMADTVHLERLVNDLLELSRLQNTNFQIEKSRLNLTDVLAEVIHSMEQVAKQKEIPINFINESGTFLFMGDYGRLRQMFTIVLDNAVKFSPCKQFIEVRMEDNEGGCLVSVKDSGEGMEEKDIPYIFDRFYRQRSEQNKNGSGLGLSIAKQIADRHGIIIQCTSKLTEGTCFSFYFPDVRGNMVE